MEYVALTEAERDELVAADILARERMHFLHALNVETMAKQLDDLPTGDWPDGISYLRGEGRDAIYQKARSDEDAELAQAYAHRDRLRHLIKTESLERDREERYHDEALRLLPEGARRSAAVAAAKERDRQAASERR